MRSRLEEAERLLLLATEKGCFCGELCTQMVDLEHRNPDCQTVIDFLESGGGETPKPSKAMLEDELSDQMMELFNQHDCSSILDAVSGYLDGLTDNVWDSYNGGVATLGDDSLSREEVVAALSAPYIVAAETLRGLAKGVKEYT